MNNNNVTYLIQNNENNQNTRGKNRHHSHYYPANDGANPHQQGAGYVINPINKSVNEQIGKPLAGSQTQCSAKF